MSTRTKKGIVLAACSWLVIISAGSAVTRYVVMPKIRGKPVVEVLADKCDPDSTNCDATIDNKPINPSDWEKLVLATDVVVEPITFGRGKSEVSQQSQRTLDEAVAALQDRPSYYLVVIGNARSDGDADAANHLVRERVAATADYLANAGLARNRIITIPSRPSGNSGEAQTVSFVVGKLPK